MTNNLNLEMIERNNYVSCERIFPWCRIIVSSQFVHCGSLSLIACLNSFICCSRWSVWSDCRRSRYTKTFWSHQIHSWCHQTYGDHYQSNTTCQPFLTGFNRCSKVLIFSNKQPMLFSICLELLAFVIIICLWIFSQHLNIMFNMSKRCFKARCEKSWFPG